MRNARLRLMAGLAGALCLFAATSYAQNPTTTGSAQTPTATTPAPTATDQTTPTPTDAGTSATVTQSSQTDAVTTTTTTRSFPGGMLGILAVAAIVLLLLFGLFRGRDKTVVKETYVTPPATNRTVTTGTTADDRMNLNSRAASGPENNPGGMNDPNARR